MKRNDGIHTCAFSKAKQGYQALQAMADSAYRNKFEVESHSDKFNLNHTYELNGMSELGIKVKIKQFAAHPGYARAKLTFGSMLNGTYAPLHLYKGKEGEWKAVQDRYSDWLDLDGFPNDLNDLSLARIDLTEDIKCENAFTVDWTVYAIGKSVVSPKYHGVRFSKKNSREEDPKEANRHSVEYCTKTKRKDKKRGRTTGIQPRTAIKAYNKTYEVNKRYKKKGCSNRVEDDILRVELTHTGTALRRKLKVSKSASNREVVDAAAQNAHGLIWRFLKSGMFTEGSFLRFDAAIKEIQANPEIKDQYRPLMLGLIRKVSDCDNICNAAKRMGLSGKELRKLLRQFAKIRLSPVTLPNEGTPKQLPCIAELMGESVTA